MAATTRTTAALGVSVTVLPCASCAPATVPTAAQGRADPAHDGAEVVLRDGGRITIVY